jgi:hypothetical protein
MKLAEVLVRALLLVCGLAAVAYSAPAAFLNGAALGHDGTSLFFGVGMVAVVIVALVTGPIALDCFWAGDRRRGLLLTGAWLVTFPLVLANSVSFTAANRVETVGSKAAQIEKAQRASEERDRLKADLQEAQKSSRWELTAGCTSNRSKGPSKVYCDQVDEMRRGLQAANATLNADRPAEADAGANELSWWTNLSPTTVARLMPGWMAVGVEVAAMAAFATAFAPVVPNIPGGKPEAEIKAQVRAEVEAEQREAAEAEKAEVARVKARTRRVRAKAKAEVKAEAKTSAKRKKSPRRKAAEPQSSANVVQLKRLYGR